MANILTEPKIEVMTKRNYAGNSRRYTMETRSQIPQQWAAYNGDGFRVAGAGPGYYGIAYNFVEKGLFDYLVGQEITGTPDLPPGFAQVILPPGPYARFATQGHITTISMVWAEVYNDWLSRPAYRPRQGPSVEYYPAAFDAETGHGGFEVWVPVEA